MANLRFWRRHEVRAGDSWDEGTPGDAARPLLCWRDGNSPDDPPAGYYPINPDGSLNSEVRLRWVDDAPHDPDNGAGHYEVMEPDGPYSHGQFWAVGTVVPLEARIHGESGVNL